MGHCCSKVKTHRKKRHKSPTKDHSKELVLDKFERDLVGSFGLKNLETPRFNDLRSSEIIADDVEPSEVEVIIEEISEAFETEKEIDVKKNKPADKKLKNGKALILFSGTSDNPAENKLKSPKVSRKSSEVKKEPIDFSTNTHYQNLISKALDDVDIDPIITKETKHKQKKKMHSEHKPVSTLYYLDVTDHHNVHAPQETPTFHSPSSRYDFVSPEP